MKFLINVLPNDRFTLASIRQLVLNIRMQHVRNVGLVFKKGPALTQNLVSYLKHNVPDSVVVNRYRDVKLDPRNHYYWLNLHNTDCLLPNAVIQWQQIIERHALRLLQLKYLNNSTSLVSQVDRIIHHFKHQYPIRLETVKQMMDLPIDVQLFQLTFAQKLAILLGIQRYEIRDGRRRFRLLKSHNLGFNVVYRCSPADLSDMDRSSCLQHVFNLVLNLPEFVKVELPTLVLGDLSLKNRLRWLVMIIKMQSLVKDPQILAKFHRSVTNKVVNFKKQVLKSNLTWPNKFTLVSKVNRLAKHVNYSLKEV